MSNVEVGSVWQGKNNEGDVVIVWANQKRVHYDYLNSLRKPMSNVYDTSIAHFLEYFELKTETIDEFCNRKNQELKDDMSTIYDQPKPVPDMVNHPPHYKDASGIECIEVTKHMQFCGGNCFKYLYRAGKKGSTVEDLKKAAWYAERAWIMNEIVSNEVFNKIFDIAHFRLGNIAAAMDSVRFNEWDMVEKHVRAEIARLESE